MNTPAKVAPKFPDSIFRAYDIRGTVPEFLNAETAYWLGRAIGAWPAVLVSAALVAAAAGAITHIWRQPDSRASEGPERPALG